MRSHPFLLLLQPLVILTYFQLVSRLVLPSTSSIGLVGPRPCSSNPLPVKTMPALCCFKCTARILSDPGMIGCGGYILLPYVCKGVHCCATVVLGQRAETRHGFRARPNGILIHSTFYPGELFREDLCRRLPNKGRLCKSCCDSSGPLLQPPPPQDLSDRRARKFPNFWRSTPGEGEERGRGSQA